MDFIIYSLIGSLTILGCLYLFLRIYKEYKEHQKSKFKTDTAHFLSDLYKLKIKWSDLGQAAYVKSLDEMILFYGIVDRKPKLGGVSLPLTNDSLSTDIHLRNQRKEELIDVLTEQGILDNEFIG